MTFKKANFQYGQTKSRRDILPYNSLYKHRHNQRIERNRFFYSIYSRVYSIKRIDSRIESLASNDLLLRHVFFAAVVRSRKQFWNHLCRPPDRWSNTDDEVNNFKVSQHILVLLHILIVVMSKRSYNVIVKLFILYKVYHSFYIALN